METCCPEGLWPGPGEQTRAHGGDQLSGDQLSDPIFHDSISCGPGSAAWHGTKSKRRWEMCLLMRLDSWGAQELHLLKQC